jgi:hypothetical protein
MHRPLTEAAKPWLIATIGTGTGFALFFGLAIAIVQVLRLGHGR